MFYYLNTYLNTYFQKRGQQVAPRQRIDLWENKMLRWSQITRNKCRVMTTDLNFIVFNILIELFIWIILRVVFSEADCTIGQGDNLHKTRKRSNRNLKSEANKSLPSNEMLKALNKS